METAIRFSQNSLAGQDQRFLNVDVAGKSFKLCKITGEKKSLSYKIVTTSTKVPSFRAFDWHPKNEDFVVVGQASGEATLLNIAEGCQDSVSFQVRSQRLCNAVSFNSQNLLAAGLDRVRTDVCLNIWDYGQKLPTSGSTSFSKNYSEPLHKLASGEPISSLKFFQGDPQLLVAGVKGQFVRLYDLREPASGNGLQFATKCVHNLAIDWRDENYFASCIPSNDPMICLWDRRMVSRTSVAQIGSISSSNQNAGQPEVSLELPRAIEQPGSIWSLRFSKSKRGCLGVLSSTGHLKVYHFGSEYAAAFSPDQQVRQSRDSGWQNASPQNVYLDRTQTIDRLHSESEVSKTERSRLVSFDFTTGTGHSEQAQIITLSGEGRVSVTNLSPPPQPLAFLSSWKVMAGSQSVDMSDFEKPSPDGQTKAPVFAFEAFQHQAQQRIKDSTEHDKSDNFEEVRLRCKAGYRIDASKNLSIVAGHPWLEELWQRIEQATLLHHKKIVIQDNLDLSYLGVQSIWTENIPNKSIRTLGPTSARVSKVIENLVARLNLPAFRGTHTEHVANRQLCLFISDLSWSTEYVEAVTEELVEDGEHFKAAFIALSVLNTDLAHAILTGPNTTQSHKSLSLAIAGSHRHLSSSSSAEAWSASISALTSSITDPYALAILSYVKHSSWDLSLLHNELPLLPLRHLTSLALRHLPDAQLTTWLTTTVTTSISRGDPSALLLTGLATPATISLFTSYNRVFKDNQTTVLALAPIIPRYLNHPTIVRRYNGWKDAYRADMMSWGMHIARCLFDNQYAELAIDNTTGERLFKPPKPQIKLVCSYCAGGIAHHDTSEQPTDHNQDGREGSVVSRPTAKNPLNPATAAALGTVCPKCDRHLPRCGVCNGWLGYPDDTFLPWAAKREVDASRDGRSVVMGGDLAGSAHTILGPANGISKTGRGVSGRGSSSTNKDSLTGSSIAERLRHATENGVGVPEKAIDVEPEINGTLAAAQGPQLSLDEQRALRDHRMRRFITHCIACSHGFHSDHARMWFEGEPEKGRMGHRVCPVPGCRCLCWGGRGA